MRIGQQAAGGVAREDGQPRPLGEGGERLGGAGPEAAASHHHHGALRLAQHRGGALDVARVAGGARRGAGTEAGGRIRRQGPVEDVLRDLQEGGAGCGPEHALEGHLQVLGDAVGVAHRLRVARVDLGHAQLLELLEGSLVVLGDGAGAGDAEGGSEGDRGVGQAGDGVREARSGGHEVGGGPAVAKGVALGGKGGRLLVARVHHANPGVQAAVQQREDVSAREREESVDLALLEVGRHPSAYGVHLALLRSLARPGVTPPPAASACGALAAGASLRAWSLERRG